MHVKCLKKSYACKSHLKSLNHTFSKKNPKFYLLIHNYIKNLGAECRIKETTFLSQLFLTKQ